MSEFKRAESPANSNHASKTPVKKMVVLEEPTLEEKTLPRGVSEQDALGAPQAASKVYASVRQDSTEANKFVASNNENENFRNSSENVNVHRETNSSFKDRPEPLPKPRRVRSNSFDSPLQSSPKFYVPKTRKKKARTLKTHPSRVRFEDTDSRALPQTILPPQMIHPLSPCTNDPAYVYYAPSAFSTPEQPHVPEYARTPTDAQLNSNSTKHRSRCDAGHQRARSHTSAAGVAPHTSRTMPRTKVHRNGRAHRRSVTPRASRARQQSHIVRAQTIGAESHRESSSSSLSSSESATTSASSLSSISSPVTHHPKGGAEARDESFGYPFKWVNPLKMYEDQESDGVMCAIIEDFRSTRRTPLWERWKKLNDGTHLVTETRVEAQRYDLTRWRAPFLPRDPHQFTDITGFLKWTPRKLHRQWKWVDDEFEPEIHPIIGGVCDEDGWFYGGHFTGWGAWKAKEGWNIARIRYQKRTRKRWSDILLPESIRFKRGLLRARGTSPIDLIQHGMQIALLKDRTGDDVHSRVFFNLLDGNGEQYRFNDYAPHTFGEIRAVYGITEEEYAVALCDLPFVGGNVDTAGKSGQIFWRSNNGAFVIKTVTVAEANFFQGSMLGPYVQHLRVNPHTLISRIFGLHKIKSGAISTRFVVMNNVFMTARVPTQLIYDLKGTTEDRLVHMDARSESQPVLKDLNFQGRSLVVSTAMMEALHEQIDRDVRFFEHVDVMDYSLLVGIAVSNPNFQGGAHSADHSEAFLPSERGVGAGEELLDSSMTRSVDEFGNPEISKSSIFERGIRGPLNETYFIGIIDILQDWTTYKVLANAWKTMVYADYSQKIIDSVPPRTYAQRFSDYFRQKIVDEVKVDELPGADIDYKFVIMVNRAADLSNVRTNSLNAYVVTDFGSQQNVSSVVRLNDNPVWSHLCSFTGSEANLPEKVKISVMDYDGWALNHRSLGVATIPVKLFLDELAPSKFWLPLEQRKPSDRRATGRIEVSIELSGRTSLHMAAEYAKVQDVRRMLRDAAINVNKRDFLGRTALLLAAKRGTHHIVSLLLDRAEIRVNEPDRNLDTPLHVAAAEGHVAVVELLLEHPNADVNVRNKLGFGPLFVAASFKQWRVVELLLASPKTMIDLAGRKKRLKARIHDHAQERAFEECIELREEVEKLNKALLYETQDNETTTRSILHMAAESNRIVVVRSLLKCADVDVNARDNNGYTPLHIASFRGNADIVELLLRHRNIDVDARDSNGNNALHLACAVAQVSVVNVLMRRRIAVDVNSQVTKLGDTSLHIASRCGHITVVSHLLRSSSIKTNVVNGKNLTALHLACLEGHASVVKLLLLSTDIDVNPWNEDVGKPLYAAAGCGHLDVVELLLGHDKIQQRSTYKTWHEEEFVFHYETAIDVATRNNHTAVVKTLALWENPKHHRKAMFERIQERSWTKGRSCG